MMLNQISRPGQILLRMISILMNSIYATSELINYWTTNFNFFSRFAFKLDPPLVYEEVELQLTENEYFCADFIVK